MVLLDSYIGGLQAGTAQYIAAWASAVAEANSLGDGLLLPPRQIEVPATIECNKVIGSGDDTLLVTPSTFPGKWSGAYLIKNTGFNQQGTGRPEASEIEYANFRFKSAPVRGIGLANVCGGSISKVKMFTDMIASATDSLIDFKACCKNVTVSLCYLSNTNGYHGSKSTSDAGGGGCIWIRAMVSSFGASAANETSGIVVRDCDLMHCTSDEALAFFGVSGAVRRCRLENSRVTSLRNSGNPAGEPTHQTLLSMFAGASMGTTDAEVSECVISGCLINDYASQESIIRLGHFFADDNQRCYGHVIKNNVINAYFIGDKQKPLIENIERVVPEGGSKNACRGNVITNASGDVAKYGIIGFSKATGNMVNGPFSEHYSACASDRSENYARTVVGGKLIFVEVDP